jgi:hypothetical protein
MKRYQLGNYIQDWQKKIAMVVEINQKGILAEYANNQTYFLEWHDMKPLEITVQLMKEMGFTVAREKDNPYHKEIGMSILLGGKFYNSRGIIYSDRSIWTFNSTTLLYVHQVQNIISIIDPNINISIPLMTL